MTLRPVLNINTSGITDNAQRIVPYCQSKGMDIQAVIKDAYATPEVCQALKAGGIQEFAFSSLASAKRLSHIVAKEYRTLLRLVTAAEVQSVVQWFDWSVHSTADSTHAVGRRHGAYHGILMAIDTGDNREGVTLDELPNFLLAIQARTRGRHIAGLLANFGCGAMTQPLQRSIEQFTVAMHSVERVLGYLPVRISIGGSVLLGWMAEGNTPIRATHIRVGEALLLGTIPHHESIALGLRLDNVVLTLPILAIKDHRFSPLAKCNVNYLKSPRKVAILEGGFSHTDPTGLKSEGDRVRVLSSYTEYTVVDVSDYGRPLRTGDTLEFIPNYEATLRAFLSPLVVKIYR